MSAIDEIYRRINDDIEEPDIDLSESNIRDFFADKSVFFSGATGFMGKVFIEKILRDCPRLKRIYVLVRHKKGVAPQDIMKKYFKNVVFERLRSINPNFEEKVLTVTGDLQQDKLGLSIEDRQILIDNVDIIVHTAATTKFDERISISLKINVLGTKHMLDLALECKRIQVFVHVSTAYSHCYRKHIQEMFYDSPADLKMVYDMIARDEDAPLDEATLKKILGDWPNVYCYSKAVAEGLVKLYGDSANFAIGVYRPSIVIASYKEPTPGWVGNDNGPALAFLGMALGIIHVGYHKGNTIDFIPVDLSVNCLIGIIYDLAERWKVEREPAVYNYGSSTLNPITIPHMSDTFFAEAPNIGSMHASWFPFIIFSKSMWKFWILHVLLHFLPACFVDLAMLCMGKKPRALRMFYFGTKQLGIMDYFGNGNWRIYADRTMEFHDRLTEADKTIFFFDIRKLDWEVMIIYYMRGTRLHGLKEPLDNLEEAKKYYYRLRFIHYAVVSVVGLMATYFTVRLLMCMLRFVF